MCTAPWPGPSLTQQRCIRHARLAWLGGRTHSSWAQEGPGQGVMDMHRLRRSTPPVYPCL
eukprot:3765862-Pyramimonas_sp.AAC.1